jgi:hypothetical protein
MLALDEVPHVPVAPKSSLLRQRRSTSFERAAHNQTEWPDPRKNLTRAKNRRATSKRRD